MNLSELPNIPASRMGARKDFGEHKSLLLPLPPSSWARGKSSLVWQKVELSCRPSIRCPAPSPGPTPTLGIKILDQTDLGSNPGSATDKLCDLEQVVTLSEPL